MGRRQYQRAPWTKEKFPNAAAWLTANDKRLNRLAEATRRERYYSPLLGAGEGPQVMGSLLFLASEGRTLGRYLAARAMLRTGSGQVRDAEQDALALHRFGRLIGQGPTLVESLVAIAIDHYGIQVDVAMARSGKLSADECRQFAAELNRLPPLPIPRKKSMSANDIRSLTPSVRWPVTHNTVYKRLGPSGKSTPALPARIISIGTLPCVL